MIRQSGVHYKRPADWAKSAKLGQNNQNLSHSSLVFTVLLLLFDEPKAKVE